MSGTIDIEKLAKLARLDLSDDEKAQFGPQIEAILGFVEQLGELDTTDVEPMTSALEVSNRFREDLPGPSLSSDVATAMAADSDEGHFVVPPVMGPKS